VQKINRLVIFLIATLAYAQDRSPLGELKAKFLSQRIVVNQNFMTTASPFLIGWNFVKEKKGGYTIDSSKRVPATVVGQTGEIVAVLAPSSLPFEKSQQPTDGTYVKYAQVIVRLDSGQLLETAPVNSKSGTEIYDPFILLSVREKHHQDAISLAKDLNGKSFYLSRLTRIYDMGLTNETIQTIKAGLGHSDAEILNAPLLTPIPVLETRYSEKLDYSIVILQLPNGRKALYVPGCVEEEITVKKYTCAATAMPSFLTDQEIDAIRKRSIFVGMSETALHMAMGFPEEKNSAVIGSTQLIYPGRFYVYLDSTKKIVEIQDHH
jgi:hypothetical protein